MKWAYYNEIDKQKAAWLRELMRAGVIAEGEVDERSIVDVSPADLDGFSQCHFFAGIGIWSYALRLAGWPDNQPVWTGSCPCQPFSSAGKREGFADERHLFPAWSGLIEARKPLVLFGEQVSDAGGLAWFDDVFVRLEALSYTLGCCDLPAAGFGAPERRQRLYFVAESAGLRYDGRRSGEAERRAVEPERSGNADRLDHSAETRLGGDRDLGASQANGDTARLCEPDRRRASGSLEHSHGSERRPNLGEQDRHRQTPGWDESADWARKREPTGGIPLADSDGRDASTEGVQRRGQHGLIATDRESCPGPVNGFWREAHWVLTRPIRVGDHPGIRPIEPGSQQVVDGFTFVVRSLRDQISAEAFQEAMNAATTDPYAREILRQMWAATEPQALWFQIGRQIGFHAAAVLLACVLESQGELGYVLNGSSSRSAAARQASLRNLWEDGSPNARPSPGPEHAQQFSREFTDALSKVPQDRALEGLRSMTNFPLVDGAPARVLRLRGYGDGIVAEVAAAFIRAYIEASR